MDTDRLTGKAKETFGKVETAIGEAVGDRETQASGHIRQTAGAAQDVYGTTKDGLTDAASDAAGSAASAINSARDTAKPMIESLKAQAKANPVIALLIAAAVGYLLAMLTSG